MVDFEKMDEGDSPLYLPVKSEQQKSSIHKTASRGSGNIERTWSLNDGYSVTGGVDDNNHEIGQSEEPRSDTEILVKWDENDPGNPRNMSLGKRWLITIFVSLGSICV
jgi:hypothetical protein